MAGKGDKGPTLYMPAQVTRRGKTGYKGERVVIAGSKADKRTKEETADVITTAKGKGK